MTRRPGAVADRLAVEALADHLVTFHGLARAVVDRARHLDELEDHHADIAPGCWWS